MPKRSNLLDVCERKAAAQTVCKFLKWTPGVELANMSKKELCEELS